MKINKTLKDIREYAETKDKKLSAKDKRFTHSVYCICLTSNNSFIDSAFYEKKQNWYIIYAEHSTPTIIHEDCVQYISELKPIKIFNKKVD